MPTSASCFGLLLFLLVVDYIWLGCPYMNNCCLFDGTVSVQLRYMSLHFFSVLNHLIVMSFKVGQMNDSHDIILVAVLVYRLCL